MVDIRVETELFAIDRTWYEERGRSFEVVVQARMCPSCQARLGDPIEENYVTLDPSGKRVITERRIVPYGSNPLPIIRDCCSRTKGYINAHMPIMEIAFRILLARGNQPISAEELKKEMEFWAGHSDRVRFLSVQSLQRMLERDEHYGFRQVQAKPAGG